MICEQSSLHTIFIDLPFEDEIQAIEEANESILLEGAFSEDQIDRD